MKTLTFSPNFREEVCFKIILSAMLLQDIELETIFKYLVTSLPLSKLNFHTPHTFSVFSQEKYVVSNTTSFF